MGQQREDENFEKTSGNGSKSSYLFDSSNRRLLFAGEGWTDHTEFHHVTLGLTNVHVSLHFDAIKRDW